MVKARMFAFGCTNAAIDVSVHDRYPAFASSPVLTPKGVRASKRNSLP